MVPPREEGHLRDRLWAANMITLVKESDIARRPDGELLVNGLFAVHHPKGQRAIFDLRPANWTEHRLKWSILPRGRPLAKFY